VQLVPSSAKIVDFETTFDATPCATAGGDIIWADVRIDYDLAGLTPRVTIRIPLPWDPSEGPDERRARALRCARELIDRACGGAGVDRAADAFENAVEVITPRVGGHRPRAGPLSTEFLARPSKRQVEKANKRERTNLPAPAVKFQSDRHSFDRS
jgi:hypothetical protein